LIFGLAGLKFSVSFPGMAVPASAQLKRSVACTGKAIIGELKELNYLGY